MPDMPDDPLILDTLACSAAVGMTSRFSSTARRSVCFFLSKSDRNGARPRPRLPRAGATRGRREGALSSNSDLVEQETRSVLARAVVVVAVEECALFRHFEASCGRGPRPSSSIVASETEIFRSSRCMS